MTQTSVTGSKRAHARSPQRWLVLAGSGESLEQHAEALRELLFGRHTLRIGYATGRLPRVNLQAARPHRMLIPNGQTDRRRVPLRLSYRLLPPPHRLKAAVRLSSWTGDEARQAHHILLLDQEAAGLGSYLRARAPRAEVWGPEQVEEVLREEAAWRWLDREAQVLAGIRPDRRLPMTRLTSAVQALTAIGEHRFRPPADLRPELRRIGRRRLREGSIRDLDTVLLAASLMEHEFGASTEQPALHALRMHAYIVQGASPPTELLTLVGEVLDHADRSLTAGNLDEAADVAAIGLGVLFHQQLHTAVETSPLITEPDHFLEPLRRSAIGQTLARTARSRHALPASTQGGPQRVVMLPGVYAHHAGPLIKALQEDPRAELVELRLSSKTFAGLMIDTPILRHRLGRTLLGDDDAHGLWVEPPDATAVLRSADIVVADWADKGTAWASTEVPSDTRLIVRVHSVDVLSAPLHLVDWSRVDDVVFVSEHIRDLFTAVVGERAAGIRQHVITNIVSLTDFPEPVLPDAARTLGMVGWGQRVKDPLLALDILAGLLEREEGWRLRLIGSDFAPQAAAEPRAYTKQFYRRALALDVVDQIDYPGFTRHLPEHLRHVGFILSTSLRESCPVGALEGVAAGAYPVVREWPAFASLKGASRLFPPATVFQTVEQAIDQIWALRDPTDRTAAVERVRAQMTKTFSQEQTEARLLDVIFG